MHHHFSDEDEEEENNEAMADIEALNIQPLLPTMENMGLLPADFIPEAPKFLAVKGSDGEDLTTYFDKSFVEVERVLSTTHIFPVIHPRQAKQIRGKWQDDCLKVVSVLVNFRKNNVSLGLAFGEQLDPDKYDIYNLIN